MRQRVAIYERSARADLSGVRAVHRRYLALTGWIANQPGNLQHTHSYIDCGQPGTSPIDDRPRLRQALADARAGAFDLLVVYDLARLARSPRVLEELMSGLDAAKIRLYSITEQLDTRIGAALLQILRVFADHQPTLSS
jgi:DNA invertase Pin-like site-specific DNA recombinase